MSDIGGSRKADVFAGEGSFSDRLRKRRMAIEEGDPTGGTGVSMADGGRADGGSCDGGHCDDARDVLGRPMRNRKR